MRGAGAIVSLSLLLACTRHDKPAPPGPARQALRADVLGCYALFEESGRRIDSSYYNAAPSVLLDSTPLSAISDTFYGVGRTLIRLDTLGRFRDDVGSPGGQLWSWSADSLSDSIHLSFIDGFSGAYLILNASPGHLDTLPGRIGIVWDLGPSVTKEGKVRAIRVPCRSNAP